MAAIEQHKKGIIVRFRAAPRASRTRLSRQDDGSLRLRVTAPPVDGAANEAITDWFASLAGVPKQNVSLASGHKGRQKSVLISGTTLQAVTAAIEEAIA